ncbi:hypothetical protein HF086_013239 [Spodoptera exigua]|uniref:Mitochondrial ribosomal protein L2 n=1 Tax=Spodoptera exigua TaxID=7107 RepID=A0A922MBU4_SPOEX|nr:hypothetical protein HF086_013239 [Spodoptera exigua]
MALNRLFAGLAITPNLISRRAIHIAAVNFASQPDIDKPKPGLGKSYRRIVHFPKEYTVKPLEVTNLAGRDPVSGRVIAKGIGGGIKHKFHWIEWLRDGPKEGPPQEEKVIQVMEDGCRTAHIALVAVGDKLKYILATENMKAGDIIKTSRELPRNPGEGALYIHAAGTFGTILRRQDDRIIVQMPSKRLFSFDQHCMAVVGRVSNVDHGDTPIGSPQRNRWLGNRPRSGLWQRKSGRHGRKIKPPKPVKEICAPGKKALPTINLSMHP